MTDTCSYNFHGFWIHYSCINPESFNSVYHSMWFLWVSKWANSDVWTMHVLPKSGHKLLCQVPKWYLFKFFAHILYWILIIKVQICAIIIPAICLTFDNDCIRLSYSYKDYIFDDKASFAYHFYICIPLIDYV